MNILVCIKRIPDTGAKMTLTEDEQNIETKHLGFTISPHEECAVEEAVLINEALEGGDSTVLTLGPEESIEQLRDALARGMENAVLLETDGSEWSPIATAQAIVEAVKTLEADAPFDLIFMGNEAADSADYQVGIRVAHALGLPCVTGVKALEVQDGNAIAHRDVEGEWETYNIDLPAVLTIKDGINVPRYTPFRRIRIAKKKEIRRIQPEQIEGGLKKIRLVKPEETVKQTEILGEGQEAVQKAIDIFKELELL